MQALCLSALCCRAIVTGVAEFEIRRHLIGLVVPCGRFATTIHILVSAVVKLTRAEKLPAGLELYRGLGGSMALPEKFYKGDENGCRGYTEWGFLSTTSNRAIAVEVSCWQDWQRRVEVKAAALRFVTFLLLAQLLSCRRPSVYTSLCTDFLIAALTSSSLHSLSWPKNL